jgi:hypothetical protein
MRKHACMRSNSSPRMRRSLTNSPADDITTLKADGSPSTNDNPDTYEDAYQTWAQQIARNVSADVMVEAVSGFGVTKKSSPIQVNYYTLAPLQSHCLSLSNSFHYVCKVHLILDPTFVRFFSYRILRSLDFSLCIFLTCSLSSVSPAPGPVCFDWCILSHQLTQLVCLLLLLLCISHCRLSLTTRWALIPAWYVHVLYPSHHC